MQTHGVPDLTHDVGHVTAAFSPCVARVRRIPRPLRNYFAKVREIFREFVDEVIRVALLQAPAASTALPPLRLPLAMSLEGLEVAESTFLWSHTSDRYANTIRAIAKSMCERVASCQLILLHSPRQPDCMGMMADA